MKFWIPAVALTLCSFLAGAFTEYQLETKKWIALTEEAVQTAELAATAYMQCVYKQENIQVGLMASWRER